MELDAIPEKIEMNILSSHPFVMIPDLKGYFGKWVRSNPF